MLQVECARLGWLVPSVGVPDGVGARQGVRADVDADLSPAQLAEGVLQRAGVVEQAAPRVGGPGEGVGKKRLAEPSLGSGEQE